MPARTSATGRSSFERHTFWGLPESHDPRLTRRPLNPSLAGVAPNRRPDRPSRPYAKRIEPEGAQSSLESGSGGTLVSAGEDGDPRPKLCGIGVPDCITHSHTKWIPDFRRGDPEVFARRTGAAPS